MVKEKFLAQDSEVNVLDYVSVFKERFRVAWAMVKGHLQVSQSRMKDHYNRKAVARCFEVGDRVLVLLPIRVDPLQAQFSGPYVIKEKLNVVIHTLDRRKSNRLCHMDILKQYYEYGTDSVSFVCVLHKDLTEEVDPGEMAHMDLNLLNNVMLFNSFLSTLTSHQASDVVELLGKFPYAVC